MTTTTNNLTVDLPTGVKDKAREAKGTAQAKFEDLKQHLHTGTEALQDKAGETTQQAKDLTDQAVAKLPEPLVGWLGQLMAAVRQRPVPAIAVVLGLWLMLRLVLRRFH